MLTLTWANLIQTICFILIFLVLNLYAYVMKQMSPRETLEFNVTFTTLAMALLAVLFKIAMSVIVVK